MAERWLPVYEAFAAAELWGDPAALRGSLEAAWVHLCGRRLTSADLARHAARLHDVTPHMDDFDAPAALAACVTVGSALRCCGTTDNARFAVEAARSRFETGPPPSPPVLQDRRSGTPPLAPRPPRGDNHLARPGRRM